MSEKSPEAPQGVLTVVIALIANALVAAAKTVAAVLSGSASMVAEAAHSWADTGNEALLLVAERRGAKPADAAHPLGYGRAAFVWSMVAAFGLFVAGSIVSITHGISELGNREEAADYTLSYVVLAVAFVLEGISFTQALRQTRSDAARARVHPFRFVLGTSQTTLRAVFFEDLAALVGLLVAAGGLAAHQLTGDAIYDAIGSICVGVLLGVVALLLLVRNGQFLVGQSVDGLARQTLLERLRTAPGVERVTFAHMEYVGPAKIFVVASVDLTGDDRESVLQQRLQAVEDHLDAHPLVQRTVLSLAAPGEEELLAEW
ncbi:cation diffusion facilitator family transporter [Ruania rhizosphaerae]|uniref:cation diffusion facilitator family transporter n=1 Tax=Ruania rhizosphaerae TaxID=1840413 RepID=UPI001357E50A|nr:cation diffusion facilitator family transporter [Ruania rhizosphaerae]